jgi:hypothetical protein
MLAVAAAASLPATASTISYIGTLDPNDPNDTWVFEFTASPGVMFVAQSYGFGGTSAAPGGTNYAGQVVQAGGFDTYLSLFAGIGPNATFLASNDDGLCPPGATDGGACRDSRLVYLSLPAGQYTLVLSVFGNISFAENLGSGTLGDGFIGLGSYYNSDTDTFRRPNWAVDISGIEGSITPIVPEPSAAAFAASGLLALICGGLVRKTKGVRNV